MKLSASFALLILACCCMAQAPAQVQAAVRAWTSDINIRTHSRPSPPVHPVFSVFAYLKSFQNVNNFLNSILASGSSLADATNVLPVAQDEPNRLALLQVL